jgi:hypothetical protein
MWEPQLPFWSDQGIHMEAEGNPPFPYARSGATVASAGSHFGYRCSSGGIMLGELLTPLGRPLTHWLHIHHRSEPMDDYDGACTACDFPFGEMNHMCIGGPSTVARDRSA